MAATTVTASTIITKALRTSGALGTGQSPLAQDSQDAFDLLNWMLSQWQRKRYYIWHLVATTLTATGANSYSIGPSGDFVFAERPDRLEFATFRQLLQTSPNQIDYPLEIIESAEDWALVALKQLQSFPQAIFMDTGYPTGTIYVWPVPAATQYQITIYTKALLSEFTNQSATVSLPQEYYEAMYLNLARRLRAHYSIPTYPGDELPGLAKNALRTIWGANAQIPRLQMPTDLIRPGIYNVFSDQIR